MTKFKIGDRVRCKRDGWIAAGTEGTIVDIRIDYVGDPQPYHVDFGGHIMIFWMCEDDLELVEEEEMENVKSLLKSGDIVIVRNGGKYRVYPDYETGVFSRIDDIGFNRMEEYDDSLLVKPLKGSRRYDITKIYRAKDPTVLTSSNLDNYRLVWERKEVKEMTMKEICDALGYDVKIKKEDK